MDQNLGGGDAIEHLNTVCCGFGCSFGMSQKKGCLTIYFPRGRKGTGIGGRHTSGFLLSVGLQVSIVLGLRIQSWVFVGPAGWAFCLLKGDLFLQI